MKTILKIALLIGLMFNFSAGVVVFAVEDTEPFTVLSWRTGNFVDSEVSYYYDLFKGTFESTGATFIETTGEFLTLEDITGISLLALYFPQRDITTEEIAVVTEYINRGGVVLLYGENNWVYEVNQRLQALASALGVSFTITDNNAYEGTMATIDNGGVNIEHPVGENVTKIGYNYIPIVEYDEPATIIVADTAGNPVILEQPLGNGSLMLFVDVNVFDFNSENSDIHILFSNITKYSQTQQDIVEENNNDDVEEELPQTADTRAYFGWMLLLGLGLLSLSKDKAKS
ncbi:MAG: hypothetical protein KGZ84_07015 [Erysipelotrichia bacterium]|jgi:nitrogen fixation protein|nr:hypothetical protein [Erysipelotrichia bacterium]